jgi:hypothetical protein
LSSKPFEFTPTLDHLDSHLLLNFFLRCIMKIDARLGHIFNLKKKTKKRLDHKRLREKRREGRVVHDRCMRFIGQWILHLFSVGSSPIVRTNLKHRDRSKSFKSDQTVGWISACFGIRHKLKQTLKFPSNFDWFLWNQENENTTWDNRTLYKVNEITLAMTKC